MRTAIVAAAVLLGCGSSPGRVGGDGWDTVGSDGSTGGAMPGSSTGMPPAETSAGSSEGGDAESDDPPTVQTCVYEATNPGPQLLDTDEGTQSLTFTVPGLPDPSAVQSATLHFDSYDADYPGEEGTITVNGGAPINLPAEEAWGDGGAMPNEVPVNGMTVVGSNQIVFAAGPRDRTYYSIGGVRLEVEAQVDDCDDPQPPGDPTLDVVEDGLVAAFAFDEGEGTLLEDLVGNHDATAHGNCTWEDGGLVHSGEDAYIDVPRGSMLEGDFSVDLWFVADSVGEAGRVVTAASDIGGDGPEWFMWYSNKLAMRMNNEGATWDVPIVGTRTSPGGSDHWAETEADLPKGDLVHLVIAHDAAAQMLTVWHGTGALDLTFQGTYSGSYEVSVGDIRLSRTHGNDARYFSGRYDQLLIYDRPLSESEAEENHDAGPHAVTSG